MCKSIFEPLCSICGLPPAMVDFLASRVTTPPVRDPDTKLYKLRVLGIIRNLGQKYRWASAVDGRRPNRPSQLFSASYKQVVDHWLNSPYHDKHLGRFWLQVNHFANSLPQSPLVRNTPESLR
jgi:hypothetical protein